VVKIALGQFDLGQGCALSIVYNLIIIIVWLGVLHRHDQCRAERRAREGSRVDAFDSCRRLILSLFLIFLLLPIYCCQHELQTNYEIVSTMSCGRIDRRLPITCVSSR